MKTLSIINEYQFKQICLPFIQKESLETKFLMVLSKTFIHKPKDYMDCNIVYIQNNNIDMQELPRQGGTIVGSQGDVECIYFLQEQEYSGMPKEIQNLVELILSKNLIPQVDNNDILINGYKVASWSAKKLNNNIFIAVVASVNVDLQLIQNICLKPMDKTPKGLSEFGITTAEVKQAFEVE